MSSGTIPDLAVVAAAADMIGGWHDDVFSAINMTEGRILADLFDELGCTGTADHIVRETWLAESDGDRDPLPWANGHGSRLSEERSTRPAPTTSPTTKAVSGSTSTLGWNGPKAKADPAVPAGTSGGHRLIGCAHCTIRRRGRRAGSGMTRTRCPTFGQAGNSMKNLRTG